MLRNLGLERLGCGSVCYSTPPSVSLLTPERKAPEVPRVIEGIP